MIEVTGQLLIGINKTLECFEVAIFEQDLEAIKVTLNPATKLNWLFVETSG